MLIFIQNTSVPQHTKHHVMSQPPKNIKNGRDGDKNFVMKLPEIRKSYRSQ